MGFQEKNAEVERPAVLEIWFFEEGRPEIERSDVTVTSHAKHSNQDQEDINNSNYPNSDTDSDHNHDDPHDSSSDDTQSDTQEESQSETEHFESVDSEDEVESDLKPKTESSMIKNLQMVTLEEVVLTLPMKNPRKVIVTATNPTMDQRVIPMIRLKNLNQF